MCAPVIIAGQGLAGTLLAWELEKRGVEFGICDDGHARAASLAAAGMVNPITGQRLVKSWRVDELLALARESYRQLEAEWGVSLWSDLRIRRLFVDQRQRAAYLAKSARGELAPYAGEGDQTGFWIEHAGRADLAVLLSIARQRWLRAGRLREGKLDSVDVAGRDRILIDCRGLSGACDPRFGFVPWEYSRGEVLEIDVEGLAPDVVLNAGHWVMPAGAGRAWVGATHEPGVKTPERTPAARAELERAAGFLLQREFKVRAHHVGVRVNLPDKRPVIGWHPDAPGVGLCNGLGAKGVLLAPWLARQWAEQITARAAFDPAVDVARFGKGVRE